MAELTADPNLCCAPEDRENCCDPDDWGDCCPPGTTACACDVNQAARPTQSTADKT
jgi:hypothetical protein